MRSYFTFVALVALVATANLALAAKVTVNPAVPASATSFQTLKAALNAYGTWSDNNDDTIEVATAGPHTIANSASAEDTAVVDIGAANSLTIQNKTGDTPIMVIDNVNPGHGLTLKTGTIALKGLTFVGPAGKDEATWGKNFTAVAMMGGPLNVTLDDCVVAANNGSNGAVTDWSITRPDIGTVRTCIMLAGPFVADAAINFTLQNSAVGFARGNDTDFEAGMGIDLASPFVGGGSLTIKNSIIARNLRRGFESEGDSITNNTTITIQDSLFYFTNRSMKIQSIGANVVVEDTIFSEMSNPAIQMDSFTGSLTIRRCTMDTRQGSGVDYIINEGGAVQDTGTFVAEDSIFSGKCDSVFRFQPESVDPPFASMTLANLAVVPVTSAVRGDQAPSLKDKWPALYGGTGPLGVDPVYASIDAAATVVGLRRWESWQHQLYRVTAAEYADKASDGGLLRGGARLTAPGPEINAARGWTLLE